MTDRIDQITEVVTMLAESFGYKSNESTYAAFLHGLSDVPIEVIQRAAIQAVQTMKWFPKVFEIRELCGVAQLQPKTEDRALIAWNAVRKSIASVGGYRSINFDDPIANATVRAMGGWNHFCEAKPGKDLDTWMKKDFIATYQANFSSGVSAEQAKSLPGINEASLKASGYSNETLAASGYKLESPVQVCLGLPEIPKNLIRGVIRDDRKPVAALTVVREFVQSLEVKGLVGQSDVIPISRSDRRKERRRQRREKVEAAKDLESGPRLPDADTDSKRQAMIKRLQQFKPRGKRGKEIDGERGTD